MNISVGSLILEVTRSCNMCCDHCLRGSAQATRMTKKMIEEILSKVDSISMVTFTGGEPTLNLKVIRHFFETAKQMGKLPSAFWLATNGKEHQLELANLLLEYYPHMDEPEMCGVAVSVDTFHGEPTANYLKGLSFYDHSKEHDVSKFDESWVIRTGKADEYGFGNNAKHRSTELYTDFYNDYVNVDKMYINAEGWIIPDCDYSYEEQER